MEQFEAERWLRDHHALIEARRKMYDLRKEVSCPFFGSKVYLTSDGFNHLLNKPNRQPRNVKEQNVKLRLLEKALNTIGASGTVQEYRSSLEKTGKPGNDGLSKTVQVEYWAFHNIIGKPGSMFLIKAIVRKIGNGQHHFWSTMLVGKVGKKLHKDGIDTD